MRSGLISLPAIFHNYGDTHWLDHSLVCCPVLLPVQLTTTSAMRSHFIGEMVMCFRIRLLLMVAMCFLTSCAGIGVRPDAQTSFQEGLALFNQGKYEQAVGHFLKATELDPNFAKAYLYTGRAYLNLGSWFDAVAPLRTANRLSPAETQQEVVPLLIDALLGAATSDLKAGKLQSSLSLLKEVIALQPPSGVSMGQLIATLVGVGGQSLSQGNLADAIDAYSDVLQLAPQNLDAYLGLARAFLRQGDLHKAMNAVGQALRIAPTNLDALSLLGELHKR
jgi:tetratricopeptide (TPR) repeat protein